MSKKRGKGKSGGKGNKQAAKSRSHARAAQAPAAKAAPAKAAPAPAKAAAAKARSATTRRSPPPVPAPIASPSVASSAKPAPAASPTAKPARTASPSSKAAPPPRRVAAPVVALPRAQLTSVRPPWSVAPTLGWFAAATVLAVLAIDGDLDAVVDLVHRGSSAAIGASPSVGPGSPGGPGDPDVPPPPLPPPPDLAPVAPSVAGAPPAPEPGVNLEEGCADPSAAACGSYALDHVYRALAATEAGTAAAPVRIAFYGDSVSAADSIPGRIRARLQDVFGDGGPGFVHAIEPHRFNYSQVIERSTSGTWVAWNPALTRIADDLYGVGMSTAEGNGTVRWRLRHPERGYAHAELYYLAHPKGGAADLVVDGEVKASVDTRSEAKAPAFQRVDLADAFHKLDLKTTRGKVRVFGVALERDRGVVVDNLAMVSATAANLQHNVADHWRDQLAHRDADLVVFMLGTNEAQWLSGAKKMSEYEQEWAALLAPVRAARPDASCLVISPLDQAEVKDDKLVPRRSMPKMIIAQRRAARAAGCAFWDSFTWMGGSGAAIKWNRRGLLGSDFAHPSPKGMAMVADAVTDALVAGYRAYKGRTP